MEDQIKNYTYFKIQIRLKPCQQISLNKWKFKLYGEERLSTLPTISWFESSKQNIDDIVHSINMNEILSFSIELPNINKYE